MFPAAGADLTDETLLRRLLSIEVPSAADVAASAWSKIACSSTAPDWLRVDLRRRLLSTDWGKGPAAWTAAAEALVRMAVLDVSLAVSTESDRCLPLISMLEELPATPAGREQYAGTIAATALLLINYATHGPRAGTDPILSHTALRRLTALLLPCLRSGGGDYWAAAQDIACLALCTAHDYTAHSTPLRHWLADEAVRTLAREKRPPAPPAEVSLETLLSNPTGPAVTEEDSNFSYGAYSTVCHIAKKTGNDSVLFALLSVVRRSPPSLHMDMLRTRYVSHSTDIDPKQLGQMIPMLYSARFDPIPSVQQIARDLWTVLVKSTAEQEQVLSTHEAAITSYVLRSLDSRNWRDREAACRTLIPFLARKSWDYIQPNLEYLWRRLYSMVDFDGRASCSVAALDTLKALIELIVRTCCPPTGSESAAGSVTAAVHFIIPTLLEQSLLSSSSDGKGLAVTTLLRLVGAVQEELGAYYGRLVSVLVECMSALEPGALQYLQFHAVRLQTTVEDMERERLQLAQSSPLQEALDVCLQSVGNMCKGLLYRPEAEQRRAVTAARDVLAALSQQTAAGVGLATRAAAVAGMSSLAERLTGQEEDAVARLLRPELDSCFQLVTSSALAEMGAAVSSVSLQKALLASLGTLAKCVSVECLVSVASKLLSLYSNSEDDDAASSSVAIAKSLAQIVHRSGERIVGKTEVVNFWTEVLVCAFVGTFDKSADSQAAWEAVWNASLLCSGAGTKPAGVKRAAAGVTTLLTRRLRGAVWGRRASAAAALSSALLHWSPDTVDTHLFDVVQALLALVPGRLWVGKGEVLEALAAVAMKCERHVNYQAEAEPTVFLTPEYSSHSSVRWQLSFRGLFCCLLGEAERGRLAEKQEQQHSLAAARAIASLPWAVAGRDASLFLSLLPALVAGAGLDSSAPTPVATADVPATARTKIVDVAAKSSSKKKTYALFGSRYGAAVPIVSRDKIQPKTVLSAPPPAVSVDLLQSDGSASAATAATAASQKVESAPAYRVKFVEALTAGWQPTPAFSVEAVEHHNTLLSRAAAAIALPGAVWALKRALLQLLAALLLRPPPATAPGPSLSDALSAAIAATLDPQAKVQLAAVQCVAALLDGPWAAELSEQTSSSLKQGEQQEPELLQAWSQLWSKLQRRR